MNAVFRGHRIGIIGLGGTGSYILDQVAKTWVDAIDLFDGDTFDNHNAYRAPGAASLSELQARPNKAEYFAQKYGLMHTGITAHPVFITETNVTYLSGCSFIFMAAADAEAKPTILQWLRENGIPTIEVGMGVRDEDAHLSGLLTVVNHFPDRSAQNTASSSDGVNEYDRNIQVADLNGLNAMLAVIGWKKYLGYYANAQPADEVVYKLFTNTIRNGLIGANPIPEDEDS